MTVISSPMLNGVKRREPLSKPEKGRWTISRLWEEYQAQKTDYKGVAFDGNRFDLYLESDFGSKAPEEIITLDVDRLRVSLLKKMAPQSVKNTMELLRRIINFGVKRSLCHRPENLHFSMPKTDNTVTEDLSSDQIEALLKTIGEEPNRQAANLMLLALYTGMRKGELFRLQWRDVNFDTGFIHIREPKGGKSQKIPLNSAAKVVLEGHERTGSDYVFPGPSGNMRTDCRVVSRIRDKAGLPKSFRPLHGLRHVYASMLASSGEVDMYTLQKLMTHKSPQMTQRYAHLRDEALQRRRRLLGTFLVTSAKRRERARS